VAPVSGAGPFNVEHVDGGVVLDGARKRYTVPFGVALKPRQANRPPVTVTGVAAAAGGLVWFNVAKREGVARSTATIQATSLVGNFDLVSVSKTPPKPEPEAGSFEQRLARLERELATMRAQLGG
jgi:hypothetical protein